MAGRIAGWLTEAEGRKLAELAAGRTALELGAFKGLSTSYLTTASLLVSVDWHHGDDDAGHGDSLPDYLATARPLVNVVPVIARFDQIVPLLRPMFDLVFVDGAHDYDSVKADIVLARSVVKPDGILACHDYDTSFDGCTKAQLELLGPPREIVDSLAVY